MNKRARACGLRSSVQDGNMDLSIVSTLYYSEPFLDEFIKRCVASAEKITSDFEFVLVDDGSPDASLRKRSVTHKMSLASKS